jgi:hypothetical protein
MAVPFAAPGAINEKETSPGLAGFYTFNLIPYPGI